MKHKACNHHDRSISNGSQSINEGTIQLSLPALAINEKEVLALEKVEFNA